MTATANEVIFWSDKNVQYLACGGFYTILIFINRIDQVYYMYIIFLKVDYIKDASHFRGNSASIIWEFQLEYFFEEEINF